MRVAILEDDVHLGELMCLWLDGEGHSYQLYATGEAFKKGLGRETFDLIILDWMLPDTSGDRVLEWVRSTLDWPIPVIFVTARDSEEDIVKALTEGADDYMVKPVRQKELLARITALGRRIRPEFVSQEILELPPFRIDLSARNITTEGKQISLTQREFDLAVFLFRNAGRLLSRSHILEAIWGHQQDINTRTVDTHVSRVRSKLGLLPENGWRLSAIYNHGYRLEQLAEQVA